MEEPIITAKRKRSISAASMSKSSSESLSKTLRTIQKEAKKSASRTDRMEEDLIEELMNLDMNKKKEARPMIRLTKRRKMMALDELFGRIKLDAPAPRKITKKAVAVPKAMPTRVSVRAMPKSNSLPKLSPIHIPANMEHLKEYANTMMLMVKELKEYEKQMKELDVLLPKMVRLTNKADLIRMRALIRETNLKDVIEYVKRKEPSIVELRRLCEKGDAAIQLMALQYGEYARDTGATKSEKALYTRRMRKMFAFLDEYQKRFVEQLYPLTERVMSHINELKEWRRSAVTTKENENLTNLLLTLNL